MCAGVRGTYHEVGLDVRKHVRHAGRGGKVRGAAHAEPADVHARDVHLCEARELHGRPADAAAEFDAAHARLELHHQCQKVLMPVQRRVDAVVRARKGAVVEAPVPAGLVQVTDDLIVAVCGP